MIYPCAKCHCDRSTYNENTLGADVAPPPLPNLNMSKKPSPIRVKDSIKTFEMIVCIWKNKANLSLDILISIALYYNTRGTP